LGEGESFYSHCGKNRFEKEKRCGLNGRKEKKKKHINRWSVKGGEPFSLDSSEKKKSQ